MEEHVDTENWDVQSQNLQNCSSSVFIFSFRPVVWLTAAANFQCLCTSRFRGVGGGGGGERRGVLAIHVWSKSRYIERVILASLYVMEAPISLPFFLMGEKSLVSRSPPSEMKFFFFHLWYIYEYITLLAHPHPVPTWPFHIELYICLCTKKLKSNTRVPRCLLSVRPSVRSHSLCLMFHLFFNILPHSYIMHFTALLLHWSGLFRRWKETGGGGVKGKESNKYLK